MIDKLRNWDWFIVVTFAIVLGFFGALLHVIDRKPATHTAALPPANHDFDLRDYAPEVEFPPYAAPEPAAEPVPAVEPVPDAVPIPPKRAAPPHPHAKRAPHVRHRQRQQATHRREPMTICGFWSCMQFPL